MNQSTASGGRRSSFWAEKTSVQAAAIAACLFAIYAWGASRTIFVGDSGELVAAVHTLGIPHPSGYPLYVLLGKLWTLLVPIGSIAFRMSLFSAACAAAACGALYALGRRLDLAPVPALFASLSLALLPSYWSQANIQRVYTLNALLLVLALTAAVAWHHSRSPRLLMGTFFLGALGFSNHTSMSGFLAAFGLVALFSDFSILRKPRLLAGCAGAVAAGLLPYLYMPIRSRMDPALDWSNPETLSSLITVVTRRNFWDRRYLESPSDFITIALDYLGALTGELLWIGALLALLGVVVGIGRRWPIGLFLLTMLGNLATMALHGSRSDLFYWHRYYIPSFILTCLLAGLGCEALLQRFKRRQDGTLRVLFQKIGFSAGFNKWLAPVFLLLPAALLVTGWRDFDRSRFRIAEEFSRTVLDSLPPGARLSANDDNILFVLIYLHLVEGLRPDIDLIMQGVGGADLPPLKFDPDVDPIYFTHHPNWKLPQLGLEAIGLTFQTVRAGSQLPPVTVTKAALDGEDDPRVPKDYLTQNLIGHFHYMLGVTYEKRDWLLSRREFSAAAAAAPNNDVLFFNLGLIFERNGLYAESTEALERSHAINPRHVASSGRERASDQLAVVRSEQQRIEMLEAEILATNPVPQNVVKGTAPFHRGLAELLHRRGEQRAARGHYLRSLELAADVPPTSQIPRSRSE